MQRIRYLKQRCVGKQARTKRAKPVAEVRYSEARIGFYDSRVEGEPLMCAEDQRSNGTSFSLRR